MSFVIQELQEGDIISPSQKEGALQPPSDMMAGGLVLRGAVKELWNSKDQEVMVAGPAETGKTIGCLAKAHALLWKYPGCQGVVVRKTYKSIPTSVGQSYERKVLGAQLGKAVKKYGGEKPEFYEYANSSRLWVAGMDNPDKVLSSERDFIYINQAEELELNDWETLITRATGRAGNMPYAQVYGDCNPSTSTHWIKQRFGPRLLQSSHRDNPALYDDDGNITEQGKRTVAALQSLTGVRYERLYLGNWVGAEGQVYPMFDYGLNTLYRAQVPRCSRFFEFVDFGFTHPFVWQRWAIDNDGRAYVTHEVYWSQRIVEVHVKNFIMPVVRHLPSPEEIICDWDAEGRATFEKYRGRRTKAATKDISIGIQYVQNRLYKAADGRPRFFYCRDALQKADPKLKMEYKPTNSLEEVEGYVWNEDKDLPVMEHDHGMDLWRYGCMHLDKPRSGIRRSRSMSFG